MRSYLKSRSGVAALPLGSIVTRSNVAGENKIIIIRFFFREQVYFNEGMEQIVDFLDFQCTKVTQRV